MYSVLTNDLKLKITTNDKIKRTIPLINRLKKKELKDKQE
jgi:hypothetical protein